MRCGAILLGAGTLVAAVAASALPHTDQHQLGLEQFLIELSPGETRWVTEDEKWALKRVCLAVRCSIAKS